MATRYWRTDGSGNWADNANWDDTSSSGAGGASYPTSSDDVIFNRAYTSATCTIGAAAACKSLTMTGASGITIAGSSSLTVSGNVTLAAGVTISWTGELNINGPSTLTTAGRTLQSWTNVLSGTLTLGDDSVLSNTLSVSDGATFNDGGHDLTAKVYIGRGTTLAGDCTWTLTGAGGYSTLYLDYSTNHTFNSSNVINITLDSGGIWLNRQNASISFGTVNITNSTGTSLFLGSYNPSFVNFSFVSDATKTAALAIVDNFTVTGTLTFTGNSQVNRPIITSNTVGTARTITLTGATVNQTDVDLRDLTYSGSPTINSTRVGDCGGNTGVDASTPKTVYADIGTTDSSNWYDNIWSVSSGGGSQSLNNYPLPQDTAIIDNATWDDTGNTLTINDSLRVGNIDASGLTEANTIALASATYYGDLILTGSGLTVTSTSKTVTLDARVKLDASDTLDINRNGSIGSGAITVNSYGTNATVKFTSALTHTGTFTLTQGDLDLNGQTITTGIFSSSNSNTRELKDSAGGGKIIVNGLTGTIFNMGTTTGLTVSNAPDIQIGNSAKTLTADATMDFGGKTFGDVKFTKHAGDYDYIIAGSNAFGTLTCETPDATYQYSDLQLTVSTDQTITSLVATGTGDYKINILSTSAGTAATLSDTTGTNTVSYCTIKDITAEGGATWDASDGTNTNVSGNTGWEWPAVTGGGLFFAHG